MKIKNPISLLVLATIGLFINCGTRPNEKRLLAHRDAVMSWLAEHHVPAVGIGLIDDGRLSEYRVFGELRRGVPADDDAIFEIASLTKPVVAMVTLKLVAAGQWDLDEPLADHWVDPDLVDEANLRKLTTRHVLSHRSGFPNWRRDVQSKKLAFQFEPGTRYQYSGEGFEYLKRALEKKLGRSLEELSGSTLFTPLGMKSTAYLWGERADRSKFAHKHNSEGKIYEENNPKYASAAYGLLTTIENYTKFGIDVINRAGLSDELFHEMVSPQINIKKNVDQGLGWQIIRNLPGGEYALVHEGGSDGVATVVLLLPVSKRGAVVFTNGDDGDQVYWKALETFVDVGKAIKETMMQMSYDPGQIRTVELSSEILAAYTGSYYVPSLQMTVKILHEDHVLKLENPYAKMVLYAESETRFFLKDDDLRIEFVRESGKTTGFLLTFRGAKPEFAGKI